MFYIQYEVCCVGRDETAAVDESNIKQPANVFQWEIGDRFIPFIIQQIQGKSYLPSRWSCFHSRKPSPLFKIMEVKYGAEIE